MRGKLDIIENNNTLNKILMQDNRKEKGSKGIGVRGTKIGKMLSKVYDNAWVSIVANVTGYFRAIIYGSMQADRTKKLLSDVQSIKELENIAGFSRVIATQTFNIVIWVKPRGRPVWTGGKEDIAIKSRLTIKCRHKWE